MQTVETGPGVVVIADDRFVIERTYGPEANPFATGILAEMEGRSTGLEAGLELAGFEEQEDAAFLIQAEVPFEFAPLEGGALTIENPVVQVDVPDGQSAVLLLEDQDGSLQWIWPDEIEQPELMNFTPANLQYTLDADFLGGEDPPIEALQMGLGGPIGWIKVRILRFVARLTTPLLLRYLERNTSPGLVTIANTDPNDWTPSRNPPQVAWSPNPSALLMMHGTFSSTRGSFSALAEFDEGRLFLERAIEQYDWVGGYDHYTLKHDPETNANDLVDALKKLNLPQNATVDLVAFSRGALVERSFRQLLAQSSYPNLDFGKVVHVATTNGGTELARPDNWKRLMNVYINLARGLEWVLNALGAGVIGSVIKEIVDILGRFVQALVHVAVRQGLVPGLAAMNPAGPFIGNLNARPIDLTSTRIAMSDFEPNRSGGAGPPYSLGIRAADGIVDRLMRGKKNDLVVDLVSMATFGAKNPLPNGAAFQFADVEEVYHTVYFANRRTAQILSDTLLPQP